VRHRRCIYLPRAEGSGVLISSRTCAGVFAHGFGGGDLAEVPVGCTRRLVCG